MEMRCPICVSEGERSTLADHGWRKTLMGGSRSFYDDEGKHHYHEVNYSRGDFRCSRGHDLLRFRRGQCWCGVGEPDAWGIFEKRPEDKYGQFYRLEPDGTRTVVSMWGYPV